jgi:membrane glycosyltransferase
MATHHFSRVLPYQGGHAMELGLILLFGLLFTWIAIGFWVAVTGFLLRRLGGDPASLMNRYPEAALSVTPLARTAIVMPIYHEPVESTLQGLRQSFLSLQATGQLQHFDFFILSDSRDPDVWLAEREAWYRLCSDLGVRDGLFYRRRAVNLHYKSGNIADFLRRWGRNYRYLVVLDADSLIEGKTLVQMVRLMEQEPAIGILQTSPTIVNARTLFARVQQFASQAYGPLFTTGLAAYQLGEAAYWGHNAILRVEPFMRYCGLRKLRGPGLFRGPISSHDFVEAAYMGRAGYEVWLEPELKGSHEESPPGLVEELKRDRRWAKGNMQHLWVLLFEPGLRLAHRMALLNGVMSYLTAPLWVAFLVLSTVVTAQLVLWPIEYFPERHALFPAWPEWHPLQTVALLGVILVLLILPKVLAVVDIVRSRRSAAFGGWSLLASLWVEMLISMLLAPLRMMAHTRFVLEAFFNMRLRWAGQNRNDETRWGEVLRNEASVTLLAMAWVGFAFWLAPTFFWWTLPVALPLLLAAPIIVWLGQVSSGDAAQRRGWLRAPRATPGSAFLTEGSPGRQPLLPESQTVSPFIRAVVDPMTNRLHQACARSRTGSRPRRRAQELAQRCRTEGPGALNPRERGILAEDACSLAWLHAQVWQAPHDSVWGQILADYLQASRTQGGGREPMQDKANAS